MDDFSVPGAVVFGARSSAAFWAEMAGLLDKIQEKKIPTFDGGEIDREAACKYTADCWVRFTGVVAKTTPVISTDYGGFILRVRKRCT